RARPTVAVLDFRDAGAGPELVESVTDVVTAELADIGVFEVLSRRDLRDILEVEAAKQALGCEASECLAEITGALGVANLVSGSVGRVGEQYIVSLRLSDRLGNEIARETRRDIALSDLTREAGSASRFLVRPLLEGQRGELIIRVSESEAEVELDGKLIGVAPLGKLELPGGPHRVRVSKKGFITWSRDIDIKKNTVEVIDAALVPSVEFIEAYDAHAQTYRTLSYITGGVGIAALGFGGYSYFVYNADRADTFNDDVRDAGCDRGGNAAPSVDCTSEFQSRRDSIEQLDTISVVSMVVGLVSLGAGIYFYATGPEPGVYDLYNTKLSSPASLSAGPTPDGGWSASATLRF
ncbi:MAG: PEGA domain-containing protein, partial [Myxococcota bacterium]